jgi:hypothetical protein
MEIQIPDAIVNESSSIKTIKIKCSANKKQLTFMVKEEDHCRNYVVVSSTNKNKFIFTTNQNHASNATFEDVLNDKEFVDGFMFYDHNTEEAIVQNKDEYELAKIRYLVL